MQGKQKKQKLSFIKKFLILNNIIKAIKNKKSFLVLGHKSPDEDCIASIVAISLILSKFNKPTTIYLKNNVHEHLQYLLDICRFNSIKIIYSNNTDTITSDTIIVCDTANESMIDMNSRIYEHYKNPKILKIEFDHHVGGDSVYIGSPGHSYVMEATSACELIGHLVFKLTKQKKLLKQFDISNIFSRNIILSILTGIVGDTNKGKYIKSPREQRYYNLFSNMYNSLLKKKTTKKSNFSNIDDIFNEIKRLSANEKSAFDFFMKKKKFSRSIGYTVLFPPDVEKILTLTDHDNFIITARNVADILAEESRRLSLVVYYDDPAVSDLIEFRIRRSHSYKDFDAREILSLFNLKNGGGHEGAIGFRLPKRDISDLNQFVDNLIKKIEKEIA